MKYLYALVFCLVSSFALAYVFTASWDAPTQNTDGSAIPATGLGAIVGYKFVWGTCNGSAFGTKIGEKTTTSLSTPTPDLAPGIYCFQAFAANGYGVESDGTAVVQRTIYANGATTPPKPKPPSNFTLSL